MRIGLTIMKQNMKQKTLNSFFTPMGTAAIPKPVLSQASTSTSIPSKAHVEQVSSPAKRLCVDKENS